MLYEDAKPKEMKLNMTYQIMVLDMGKNKFITKRFS